jgi:hypothetical protein
MKVRIAPVGGRLAFFRAQVFVEDEWVENPEVKNDLGAGATFEPGWGLQIKSPYSNGSNTAVCDL